MNNYTVRVRPLASNELARHVEFLSRKSVASADKLIDDFVNLEVILSENPTLFPIFYKNFRKAIIEPRYAILFEIESDIVFVDKILDARQLKYNNIILELGK